MTTNQISTTNNILEMYNRTNLNFTTTQDTIRQKNCFDTPSKLENQPPKDTFEYHKRNTRQTIIKGSIITLLGLTAFGLSFPEKIPKCLKRKIKYPTHVEFSPAKTLKEAKDISKKIWKIKDNEISDLNIANWLNYSFTIASNKLKGKIKLPRHITYNTSKDATASINAALATLNINKNYMEEIKYSITQNFIDLFNAKYLVPDFTKKSVKISSKITCQNLDQINDLLYTYIEDISNKTDRTSFIDKMILHDTFNAMINKISYIQNNPTKVLKDFLKNKELIPEMNKLHIPTDFNQLSKLPKEKQLEIINKILIKYNRKYNLIPIETESGSSIILHEIGHLMHYNNMNKIKLYDQLSKPEECMNIFGEISSQTKEFKDSEEIQAIASYISDYATESPLEFVAETFTKLINNNNLPNDVMDLYKKYNGPTVNIN